MTGIAIYGKGGIGKSTTTANLAAALARRGLTVLQIGCDPKSDSTCLHLGGREATTVLDLIRAEEEPDLERIVARGEGGVLCVEAGGPTPGVGCAGRGIITAFEKLEELEAFETYEPDVVLYDVLGDVVCGGFASPMRRKWSERVYIVTSGEKMALFAARNIAKAIENFRMRNYASLGGMILNRRNVEGERERVEALAEELGCRIVADIPRSELITRAEDEGRTAVAAFPESDIARLFDALASEVLGESDAAAAGAASAAHAADAAGGAGAVGGADPCGCGCGEGGTGV